MNKKRILIIGFIVLLIVVFYQFFLKEKEPELVLAKVERGSISQEIFESGQVEMGERINLNFNRAGRVEDIYVKLGDQVEVGQKLAELEAADILIQLEEAKISLELARLNMEKLLSGAGYEEIKIVQSQVENAQIALIVAEKNLNNGYESSLTVLNNSYLQIYNVLDFVKEFVKDYIVIYDEEARKIIAVRNEIENEEKKVKSYLEIIQKGQIANKDFENIISSIRSSLEITFHNIENIRDIVNKSIVYQNKVSAKDKTLIDTLKTSLNSVLTEIITREQVIFSLKLSLEAAKTTLEEYENRLALVTVESSQVDIDLHQAQIKQAEARVRLYENQLKQTILVSPVKGRVIEIKKKIGELVQPVLQDGVVVVLPDIPYEIRINIYEEDIVKISVGNPVEIALVALSGEVFEGSVFSISPAEKMIDGVVYYEIIVGFNQSPLGMRPGMTADINIQTDLKEDVLIIPREAIQRKEGKNLVKVLVGDLIEEREIEIGIRGADNMVEIISGVAEDEKVILN
jgi:RND family efflux transporter MFP subunit